MQIPKILLPDYPIVPKPDDPVFMLETPRIYIFKHGGAINLEPVEFRDRYGNYHFVPMGLPCDGMSYPWLCRRLLGWDRYDRATIRSAWLHNKNYALNDYFDNWKNIVSRQDADDMLHDGLTLEKPKRADIAYFAVHYIGGYAVWSIKRREEHMEQWLDMVGRSEVELKAWVQGLIADDK